MTLPQRRTLRLALLDNGAAGLHCLLSDGRSLLLHERQPRPPGDVPACTRADQLLACGLALAEAWLPAAVRSALAQQDGGWLLLQLDASLLAVPWELAALPGPAGTQHLDERFTVVRQVMLSGTPPARPRHREPGALLQVLHTVGSGVPGGEVRNSSAPPPGRFGPLLRRVHWRDLQAPAAWRLAVSNADIVHWQGDDLAATAPDVAALAQLPTAPRLLVHENLPADQTTTLALAASRAGLSALLLAGPAPDALAVFYAALAEGAAFGQAAQRARAAARHSAVAAARAGVSPTSSPGASAATLADPGITAWFYGDGQAVPLHPAAALTPAAAGGRATSSSDDLRQITILSVDLVDSTGLMHRLGDEVYSERLTHYHRRVADAAQRHGGLADDPQGDDGFMCYFGYPVATEDAAASALRAGLLLTSQCDDLGLQLRIGISTGRVVIRNGQPVGAAVHHAARLQQRAGAGGVLASEATRQIAGERFEFCLLAAAPALKGFDDGGPVYRVTKERPAQGTERFDARAHLTPLVGREAELARLQQCWQAAMAGSRQVLVLQGEAGIGKSRLVHEFRRSLAAAGHRTLECRCAPEHSASAFQPMIELLRKRLHIQDDDPPALQLQRLRQLQITTGPAADEALALLGSLLAVPAEHLPPLATLTDAGSAERRRERTMDLLVRISQGLDEQAPVCLIVEDVHWIDPSTRALVQRLADGPRNQRLLLLLTVRSSSADGAPVADAGASFDLPKLTLGGLGRDAAQALLQGAIGQSLLSADLASWLMHRADGVPLFIEESARMAAALTAQKPSADIAAALRGAVPATLQDLLMARLDQLPLAKRAAQLGSALGRSFSQAQIDAANQHADSPIRLPALASALAALDQAGLLTAQGDGEQRHYTFKHALVRDAAYQSLLERDRRQLHACIAAVLQHQFSALVVARPELLALHQERAGQATAAIAGWERAARHAAQRSALAEALAHTRRALALLARQPGQGAADQALSEPLQHERAELRLQLLLAGLLIATAGYGADPVQAVYRRALDLSQTLGDVAALTKVRLGLEGYHFMRADFAGAHIYAQALADDLGPDADPLARIQSTWAQANLLFHQGHLPQAVVLTDQCLADYQRLGHHPSTVQDPGVMCLCYSAWALWELGHADQALQRAQRVVALAEQLDHRFSIGQAFGFLAVIHYFRGEYTAGLLAAQRAVQVCEAGGFAVWLAHAKVMQGRLAAELGDLDGGLAAMQQGHAMWAASGAVVTRPFYLALQAEVLALAGRPDDALARVVEAHTLIQRHGERYYEPEVLRLRGELLLQCSTSPGGVPAALLAQAQGWLQAGLDAAHAMHLPGMALKCALSLARLALRPGQAGTTQPAAALLAPVLRLLTEGQGTRDLQQANALLLV